MVPNLPIERFRSNQIIFNKGDAPGDVYVVISGQVEIFTGEGTNETIIATLGEDDVFGDMALIDNAPRSASARASANTSCYCISMQAYQDVLEQSSPMVQAVLKILSKRLKEALAKTA